ncbi:MAG: carbohydrate ABC transporter permease [Caldilineaceae bacterium]|nr:carbohydrate ABC transporter permease [Caldilineaceae bacterium]MCB9138322.1 carbohydrate ABC transporter permease [Caldilineaceae bacterium]
MTRATQLPDEPNWKRRARLQHWLATAILVIVAAIFLLPLIWMLSSSLKPEYQVFEMPPRLIPHPVRWQNYREALTYVPFGRYSFNTAFITLMVIVGHVLSCTLVAYGFARLRAPGRDTLFILVLATLMLPYPVTMAPLYVLFNRLGWVNTFLPLIVPAYFGSAFYIFLLRQFFLRIPNELEDAARIDGANLAQILYRIILPLSMPAIATVAIFTFQFTWNDFLTPLIYLHDQRLYTVALGLNFFRSSFQVNWAYLMAASLVTMLPVLVVFFLAQRLFIQGISVSGIKG